MDPLFSFLPYLIVAVTCFVAGIAVDHWAKRQGSFINTAVTEVRAVESSVVSESAHVATVTAVIKAALAATVPPVPVGGIVGAAQVPPKPVAPPAPVAAAPAAVKPAA